MAHAPGLNLGVPSARLFDLAHLVLTEHSRHIKSLARAVNDNFNGVPKSSNEKCALTENQAKN